MPCADYAANMDKTPGDAISPTPMGDGSAVPQPIREPHITLGLKEWEALSPLRREILRQLFIARKEETD